MAAQPATHLSPVTGHTRPGPVLVADAVAAFLSAPRLAGSANTRRAYSAVLHRLADRIGPTRELAALNGDEVAAALAALWSSAAPSTWNRNRAAVSSWLTWCTTKARWTRHPRCPAPANAAPNPATTPAPPEPGNRSSRVCPRAGR